MSDSDTGTTQLSLGFDTQAIVDGAKAYSQASQSIQEDARATVTTHKKAWDEMTRDELIAQQQQEQARLAAGRRWEEQKVAQARMDGERDRQQLERDRQQAEQAKVVGGQVAMEYLKQLKLEFAAQEADIKMAVVNGLMNKKQAQLAARNNAIAYNEELQAALGSSMVTQVDPTKQLAVQSSFISSLKNVGAAAQSSVPGLSRLQYSIASMAASSMGAVPIVGRLSTVLLMMGGAGVGGIIALLGAVVAVAAAWKYLEAPTKAADEAMKSYSESAKYAHQNVLDLKLGLGDLGKDIKVPGATAELEKLGDEIKKLKDMMTGSSSTGNMRALLSEFKAVFSVSSMTDTQGGGLLDVVTKIEKLNDSYRAGTKSLADYNRELTALKNGNKDVDQQIASALALSGALQGVLEKQRVLTAEVQHTAAVRAELIRLYGDPAEEKLGESIANLRGQLAALASGGKDALTLEKDRQKSFDAGQAAWDKYTTSVTGAAYADLTYRNALKEHIPMAVTIAAQTATQSTLEARLTKAVEDNAKAVAEKTRLQKEAKAAEASLYAQQEARGSDADQANQLVQAALQGNDAYAKLDAQLRIDSQVKQAQIAITKELTDAQTGRLKVSEDELENFKRAAEYQIRAADTDKNRAKEIQANNTTATAIAGQLALADAYNKGAMAVKDEGIELKHLADVMKAGEMTDDAQRKRALDLADAARDAAYRVNAAKDAAKQRDDEAKEAAKMAAQTRQNTTREFKTLQQDVQHIFVDMFQNIFDGGADSFGKLMGSIKQLFVKGMAEMLAMKLAQALFDSQDKKVFGISSSLFSPEMLAKLGPDGASPSTSNLSSYGAAVGIGLGGLGAAYSIGGSSGSSTGAALGGAASGAAAGAAIGSIVPVIGTAVGAVVGGLAGLVTGLIGHAAAIKKARREFADEEQKYIDGLATFPSSLAQQFAAIQKAFQDLQDKAKDAHTSVSQQAADAKAGAEKALRDQFTNGLTSQLNALKGPMGDFQNQLNDIETTAAASAATARALGLGQAALNQVEELRIAQEKKLVGVINFQNKQDEETLKARQLQAQGNEKDLRALQELMEIQQAIEAGRSAEYIALLKETQAIEDETTAKNAATQAALDAAAAAEAAHRQFEALTVRYLAAIGNAQGASDADFAARQRQEMQDAIDRKDSAQALGQLALTQMVEKADYDAAKAAAAQIKLLQQQLDTDNAQLSVAKDALSAAKQARDALATFKASLSTGQFAIGTPGEQRDAALSQLKDIYNKAKAGDATAAGKFTDLATQFLTISQRNYASTAPFGEDQKMVASMTDDLSAIYESQSSLQQQMVDALNTQINLMTQQITMLQDGNNIAKVAQNAVVAEIEKDRNTALDISRPLLAQFDALADGLSGAAADIVNQERQTLNWNMTAITASAKAEIDAINAGASLEELATRDQIRKLDLTKNSTDNGFAQQIAQQGKLLGFDSPTVKNLITLQNEYDAGVKAQLVALQRQLEATRTAGTFGAAMALLAQANSGPQNAAALNPIMAQLRGLGYTLQSIYQDLGNGVGSTTGPFSLAALGSTGWEDAQKQQAFVNAGSPGADPRGVAGSASYDYRYDPNSHYEWPAGTSPAVATTNTIVTDYAAPATTAAGLAAGYSPTFSPDVTAATGSQNSTTDDVVDQLKIIVAALKDIKGNAQQIGSAADSRLQGIETALDKMVDLSLFADRNS